MTLKLEVGKTYVTADGTPVKIESKDHGSDWPFNGSDGDCYQVDGRCDGIPCRRDLVSELQEPGAPTPNDDGYASHRRFIRGEFLDALMLELVRSRPVADAEFLAGEFRKLVAARDAAE